MKIVYAKFKGYVGFTAIMGVDELEIDFSKATHKICLIVGMNGSGKSTLMSALNIFPDNSSAFVKDRDASKLLRLVDNDNIYEIEILSPVDGKGGRKTTKAFIRLNGEELNPNGNVSSYKEIIYNEFELDSNFISLSLMTSVDRGLGDKRPAERKKFVSNVIENLVTYNNMYKTLNKKSLLYKSHIGTLHTKIQSAGDKNALESNLKQLEYQQEEIEKLIEKMNYDIVYIQTKASIDPEEAKYINDINEKRNNLQSDIDSINNSIAIFENRTKIKPDAIISQYEKDNELLNTYTQNLNTVVSEWKNKQEQLQQSSQTINQLNASIGDQGNVDRSIERSFSISNNTIADLHKRLRRLRLNESDTDKISIIKELLENFTEFIYNLDSLYDQITREQIEHILIYNQFNVPLLQNQITEYNNQIIDCKNKIDSYNKDLRTLSVLDQRPSKCKINDCPFISEAYTLSKDTNQDEIIDKLSKLQEEILTIDENINSINNQIEFHQSLSNKAMQYQILCNTITKISKAFSSDSYYGTMINKELSDIDNKLINMYQFNLFRDPKVFIECMNTLVEYESESKQNELLKVQYNAYRDKLKMITSTRNTIKTLEEESNKLVEEISDLKNKIDKYQQLIDKLKENYSIKSQYADKVKELESRLSELDILNTELKKIEKKSSEATKSMENINNIQAQIESQKIQLQPIKENISDIKGRLTLLDSYYKEYNQYNESFKFIEILKKYCSPTGGGIQTVFMQMYMAKTLELSNQILAMLFGGSYRLGDFIINQNEFRIPFIGPNGIPVDDISNGSNSQICMFGMIINLVLLHQASTKFNIAYLDEIDGGLDHRNRFEFINTLYNAIPMLGIDQLFMISHSMEADMSNVDIIKLKNYNDFEDTVDNGNIIFDYNNFISNG